MPRRSSAQHKESSHRELITHTDYMYSHFEELVPINLKYVAALNGYSTCSLQQEFTYLDLSCGNGITLALTAAAYPQARFIGIDGDPRHVEFANRLIEQGQLDNLQIIASADHKYDLRKIPNADMIVAHGLFSWTSDEHRERLIQLIDKKLKQNGLFYVNYNTLPGWSVREPFLELMHYFTPEGTDAEERVREGIKQLQILSNENAGYFSQNPILKTELNRLSQKNLQYLLHEYMSEEWHAFYFRQVNDMMESIGLQLAGSFPFRDNFKNLIIPKNFHSLLDMQPSRAKYEEYKDFVINSRVRKNIYIRSESEPMDVHSPELYNEIYLTSLRSSDELSESVQLGSMKYDIKGPAYDALRQLMPKRSYTMAELLNEPAMRQGRQSEVIDVINNFVILHQGTPCNGKLNEVSSVDIKKVTFSHPLNQFLLDHVYPKGNAIMLACQATGTLMACNHVTAIVLDSLITNHGDRKKTMQQALQMAHELHEDELFPDNASVEFAIEKVEKDLLIWLARMDVIH